MSTSDRVLGARRAAGGLSRSDPQLHRPAGPRRWTDWQSQV